MKLYYFAGSCSLATHIALREAGFDPETIEVSPETRLTKDGRPFGDINPKGYVPALFLDDGAMLTENVALLDWVAQQSPALRPADGMGRTRQLEMLSLISTEIHKAFLALFFLPGEEAKPVISEQIVRRFDYLAEGLSGDYLLGDAFSVADAFLYVMLRWAQASDMKLPGVFDNYVARIASRPAVKKALAVEGLD